MLQNLRAGLTFAEAAEAAGVAAQTAKNWASRGRAEIGTPYADFALAVDAARDAAGRAVMSDEEFRGHVNRAVRSGSVQAMKLWSQLRAEDDAGAVDPFSELDALDALTERRDVRRSTFIDELSDRKLRESRLKRLDAQYQQGEDEDHAA